MIKKNIYIIYFKKKYAYLYWRKLKKKKKMNNRLEIVQCRLFKIKFIRVIKIDGFSLVTVVCKLRRSIMDIAVR